MKVILAGNKKEAAYYADQKGLSPVEWEYISNPEFFLTWNDEDFEFVITGSADQRVDFSQICKAAMTRELYQLTK